MVHVWNLLHIQTFDIMYDSSGLWLLYPFEWSPKQIPWYCGSGAGGNGKPSTRNTNIGYLSNPETDPEVPSAAYYLVILFPPGLYLPFTVPSWGTRAFEGRCYLGIL